MRAPALLGAIALAAAPAALPRDAAAAQVERARYLMGTVCTAVAEGGDTTAAGAAIAAAFDEIARLEGVMSSWRQDSELSRMNAAAAEAPFRCSPDLFAAVAAALAAAEETGGAFDPTIEPLDRAWDMRGPGRLPAEAEIAAAVARVGWREVALAPGDAAVRFAGPGMGLDLGGIGKGLALDRAAEILASHGVARALLNFGGETLALSTGAPWTITVAHPVDRLRPVIGFTVRAAAVSTSAQSERGIEVRGRHYGHILDPRTGRPLERSASATVVAVNATRADALSTALLVIGREDARRFAAQHPDLGVLWLEPAGRAVHAWRWNLADAAALPGAAVRWMDPTPNP
ncbi:MAG TPA: FAD:protein FMN transferase [Candidatus Eisenbacteria bacterium]